MLLGNQLGKQNPPAIQKPWLFWTSNDVAAYMAADSANFAGAVGANQKIYGIATSSSGSLHTYSSASWAATATSIGAAGTIQMLYMDSRGYLFSSWDTGATNGRIMRSTDGGATWAASLIFPRSADYCAVMCESDNGYLFAHAYSAEAAPTATIGVWRSVDGGANWVNITANLAITVNRHIHGCFWDNYRKLLFVTNGDGGVSSKIQVSADYGTTFSSWTGSFQTTAMAFDSDNIYLTSDQAGDSGIYKLSAKGMSLANVVASTPVLSVNPLTFGGDGFCRWGLVDSNGYVVFPYISGSIKAMLMVSPDKGATWYDMIAPIASGVNWAKEQMHVSPFNSGWDGFFYGIASSQKIFKWRLYPTSTNFLINSSGTDYTKDGINTPWATIPDYGIDSAVSVRLTSDYANTLMAGLNGLTINKNGFSFTAATPGAPALSDSFEGAAPLSASINGTVVLNQADVISPHTGSKHMSVNMGTGGASWYAFGDVNTFGGQTDGAIVWVRFWINITNAAIAQASNIWKINNGPILTFASPYTQLQIQDPTGKVYRQNAANTVLFPFQQYVKVKVRIKLSGTAPFNGEMTVWQNNKLIYHVVGVKTFTSPIGLIRFGLQTADTLIAYYDDIAASLTTDPDQSVALTLNGTQQAVLPDGIYT